MQGIIAFVCAVAVVGAVAAAAQEQPPTAAPAKPAQSKQPAAKQPSAKQPGNQAAKPAQPSRESGPCIGVLSRLGETFTLRRIGITVFGNEEVPIAIENWHIDDLVTARIAAFVNKRAAVRRITYPHGAFASIDTPQFLRNDIKEFEAMARPFLAGTRCARYVAVIPFSTAYLRRDQILKGLGMLSGPGFIKFINVYAIAELRVYDEKLAFLHNKYATLDPNRGHLDRFLTGDPIAGPHLLVDESLWSDAATAAQNPKLREAVRDLVTRSLDATLPVLNLMP